MAKAVKERSKDMWVECTSEEGVKEYIGLCKIILDRVIVDWIEESVAWAIDDKKLTLILDRTRGVMVPKFRDEKGRGILEEFIRNKSELDEEEDEKEKQAFMRGLLEKVEREVGNKRKVANEEAVAKSHEHPKIVFDL